MYNSSYNLHFLDHPGDKTFFTSAGLWISSYYLILFCLFFANSGVFPTYLYKHFTYNLNMVQTSPWLDVLIGLPIWHISYISLIPLN